MAHHARHLDEGLSVLSDVAFQMDEQVREAREKGFRKTDGAHHADCPIYAQVLQQQPQWTKTC